MSESDVLDKYFRPLARDPGAFALTDDVALMRASEGMIATIDTLIEEVHFLSSDPLDTVGRKLVRVNVSDIFCKGALPAEALLSFAWPKRRSEARIADFAAGLGEDLARYGVSLIGGDTVFADGPLTLTLVLTGRPIAGGPIRRSGGGAGDDLWVTGRIGAGGLGLRAARAGAGDWLPAYRVPDLPPPAAARLVAQYATASMDVSDGLLLDASRLGEASGLGVVIELESVPFADPSENLEHLLFQATSGDDYQILFAAPSTVRKALVATAEADGVALTRIGGLKAGEGVSCRFRGEALSVPDPLGFEHGE